MEGVTVLEGKAGTSLQPYGKFRRIPTAAPALVGLVVDICVSGGPSILKDKPREINGGVGLGEIAFCSLKTHCLTTYKAYI